MHSLRQNLPVHILLRLGISETDISKALVKDPLGIKLAVVDGLRDFRKQLSSVGEIVKKKSSGTKAN
jgi:hypothetical protein